MRARWVPLTAILLLAPACSSGDDDDDTTSPTTTAPTTTTLPATTTTTTTTPAPTTTTTVADEEAAVIAAYLGSWDTYFAVTNPAQPDSPLIDQFSTGAAAERVRSVARERLAANEITVVPNPSVMEHDVRVAELEGDTAVIEDCFVNDAFRQDLATGEQSNVGVGTLLIRATVTRSTDDRWLVSDLTVLAQIQGAATCDAP